MEKRYALRDALRDDQWERLRSLGLPGCDGHVGVTAKDNRLFVEAVLYRFRAGIPWRDLPPCRSALATGTGFMFVSTGGVSKVSGYGYSSSCRKTGVMSMR